MILRARLGPSFRGVGENWTDRFLSKHSGRIRVYSSSPLDKARANGANPVTHELFFKILKETIEKYNIEPDCIFGADETGFLPGRAGSEKVIGKAGKKEQHAKESGNRNLITVMPTICTNGTSIPPLVIFSGIAYLVSWKQDNPLHASIGCQKKGYMDGELCVDWIKHVDHYTKAKAGDQDRLIFLDQHRSRFTLPFLLYCQQKRIHVVCYMLHATQLYQGLDTVCFGILKLAFGKEMRKFEECTGEAVTKNNFLSVYGPAHVAAFTADNVKAAFSKTGIHPYNPSAIPLTVLKPSVEFSCSGDGLPLAQSSPVK
ncbi:hypothetical protein SCHPADRAFT_840746, partial [Schizopora paradoxa]